MAAQPFEFAAAPLIEGVGVLQYNRRLTSHERTPAGLGHNE